HQVNPDKSFASIGLGSSTASNGIMSSMMSTNIFYKLPDNMGMVEGQYDVMAGHWPENYDEIVLVLTPGGSMSDFMLYSMGLRDHAELESMVRAFANEEAVNAPSDSLSFSYDDLMGVTFKLVNAADFYQRDNEYGVWKDKSGDDAYMRNLVDNGETLKIAGVVKPKEGAKITSLQTGLY
ncbi:MAG: ABC transporter, partial [Senegalimassilia sp.]|nr:ABC transporter [Senegalimassilia sp.]